MKDYFDKAPKTTRTEKIVNGSKLLEAIENNQTTEKISSMLLQTNDEAHAKSEIWKFLSEKGVSPLDKFPGEKTPCSYFNLEKLINLLKTKLNQKEAA